MGIAGLDQTPQPQLLAFLVTILPSGQFPRKKAEKAEFASPQ